MPEHKEISNKNVHGNGIGGVMLPRSRKDRSCSFHARYLEQCRAKNCAPIAEIRKNNKDKVTLDFYGDKLSLTDWIVIAEAIRCDQMLYAMSIRLRKCLSPVLEHLDTERKTKLYKEKPFIYAKFIFSNLIDSVAKCIEMNNNLRILSLEGLPINNNYMEILARSLSTNPTLKELSFARSNIYDLGCEIICNTIKYMNNIEKLNLNDTGLTAKGAEHIANMIKIQKISRYTEGWQLSLRYSEIDTSQIAGIHTILLARNPQIGNEGLNFLVDVLKEDVWVKIVDMEACGLTDAAASLLLDCLNVNHYLMEFNIAGNPGISKCLLRKIAEQIKKDNNKIENTRRHTSEELLAAINDGRMTGAELNMKNTKFTMQQLIDQIKESNEQLELEKRLREKAEQLNEKLTTQIKAYEAKLGTISKEAIPEGHVVIKNESLQTIIKERNELQNLLVTNSDEANDDTDDADDNCHQTTAPPTPLSRSKRINFHGQQEIEIISTTATAAAAAAISPIYTERTGIMAIVMDTPHNNHNNHPQHLPNKLRKVKSEIKYMEPQTINRTVGHHSSRHNETKSDYDYGTESDICQIETNIGDTLENTNTNNNKKTELKNSIFNNHKKCEPDGISLSTVCSKSSDALSNDSTTLRCNHDDVDVDDFLNHEENFSVNLKEYGQGEGSAGKRSPRSMFLEMCNETKAT